MNANEIVRALRNCGGGPEGMKITREAADLIEQQETEIKRLNDEPPAYRFYYCESEDSYLLGRRMDTMYYARWNEGVGFVWEMSRYLPWGETIDGRERGCAWGGAYIPIRTKGNRHHGMVQWILEAANSYRACGAERGIFGGMRTHSINRRLPMHKRNRAPRVCRLGRKL